MSYRNQDYHIHSFHSFCGWDDNTPGAILERMQERGFEVAGFSDHYHPITDPGIFPALRRELSEVDSDILTLVGAEVDLLSPLVATLPENHEEFLDYIIVAPNHFQLGWVDVPALDSARQAAEYVLLMHRQAASFPFTDIIAHPFRKVDALGDETEILKHVRPQDIEGLVAMAKANGAAFEFRLENKQTGPVADILLELYRQCHAQGCKVASGSDAHWLDMVGRTADLQPAVEKAGLTDDDFLDLSFRAGKIADSR